MQHKLWIDNYAGRHDQLAEEMGDLQYDTLTELLDYLSQKIERDGQKDEDRGRTQLARRLQQAARAIKDGARHIEEAWRISEPYIYPADIRTWIRTEFHEKEQQQAFQLLSQFHRIQRNDPTFRLTRCILYGTKGSLEQMKVNIRIARTDWRDIIMQAEYDDQQQWLRNLNRPLVDSAIRPEDLNPPKREPSPDDDLPF
ncbi:MAG: hypothetical protein AAGH79_17095 [Bacteroidota bacterium]